MSGRYDCLVNMEGPGHAVRSLAVFADNDLIVSNYGDKRLRLWRMSTGENLKEYQDATFGEGMVATRRNEIATGADGKVKLWAIN